MASEEYAELFTEDPEAKRTRLKGRGLIGCFGVVQHVWLVLCNKKNCLKTTCFGVATSNHHDVEFFLGRPGATLVLMICFWPLTCKLWGSSWGFWTP